MATVISVENISKLYRLGELGIRTLGDDLNQLMSSVLGRKGNLAKIIAHGMDMEANAEMERVVRVPHNGVGVSSTEYIWALKDVSFQVEQGEVIGIVGGNGAGKSTLLKILNRTTTQTSGLVKMRGRLASLLEVASGFHPDLTGRENIYLNGTILGMRRSEIKAKLDAIIDFAGIDHFVDTPVKRYSSGMYVKLAFAVGAHLESDILIVDEVLAVGDEAFQKKCLGKMNDMRSNEGRTILFVSHNLESIKELSSRSLLLESGRIKAIGTPDYVLSAYYNSHTQGHAKRE